MNQVYMQRSRQRLRGMALIAVLWIVAALAILATGMTQSVRQQVRVTVSIGVAAHTSGTSVAQLLDQADQALYLAKSQGRNRVVEAGLAPKAVQPEVAAF